MNIARKPIGEEVVIDLTDGCDWLNIDADTSRGHVVLTAGGSDDTTRVRIVLGKYALKAVSGTRTPGESLDAWMRCAGL